MVSLERNLILAGVVGSQAYGLAHADSDVDRLGVYAAPTIQFHGLHPPIGKQATIVQNDPDVTYHEVGKFCSLVLKGNPTVTELLWLDEYETLTMLGDALVTNRRSFLSARAVRNSYFGYATAQFQRLLSTGQYQSKMRARAAKHSRHLLRLLQQGLELYSTGDLTIKVSDPEFLRAEGDRLAEDPRRAEIYLDEARKTFDEVKSPLPEEPDEARVEQLLYYIRDEFYEGC